MREPDSEADIWWGEGSPNLEMDPRTFLLNRCSPAQYFVELMHQAAVTAATVRAGHTKRRVTSGKLGRTRALFKPCSIMALRLCIRCICARARERAVDYLNSRDRIYVVDGYAGWDPEVG